MGRGSAAAPSETMRAIWLAPFSWKCVLSATPSGKAGYWPGFVWATGVDEAELLVGRVGAGSLHQLRAVRRRRSFDLEDQVRVARLQDVPGAGDERGVRRGGGEEAAGGRGGPGRETEQRPAGESGPEQARGFGIAHLCSKVGEWWASAPSQRPTRRNCAGARCTGR